MKRYKFYIIIVDNSYNFDHKKFKNQIGEVNGILAWWHYMPTAYIVKVNSGISSSDIAQFLNTLDTVFESKFFVSEVILENSNGILPPQAWEWIQKQVKDNSQLFHP
ncbi:hypothetical protein CGC48_00850 [Capnocytophaga cynodegmi]|uniref:Uncharacterized protein n=1 Tax=Capnocytophaga cynodegmi TaxID=28189 RepID=A0A286NTF4_9FLAO|nr:hypothetical protein [Capnocytophaga cynodegmi]ATA67293.1 hypothetical protein CGC48_00850 [Capnocytophaga cynodegmi]